MKNKGADFACPACGADVWETIEPLWVVFRWRKSEEGEYLEVESGRAEEPIDDDDYLRLRVARCAKCGRRVPWEEFARMAGWR
ncbi:MAG: hypothetical protein ABIM88_00270 [candidate division WOR-3 bacterium]